MSATSGDLLLEKTKLTGLILTAVTAVAGPFVAWHFAKQSADSNHAVSSIGYETLAKIVNSQSETLGRIDVRLTTLEQRPLVTSYTVRELPAPRFHPPVKSASVVKAPVVIKVAPPPPPPPMPASAPASMAAVVRPTPKSRPHHHPASFMRAPDRLTDFPKK